MRAFPILSRGAGGASERKGLRFQATFTGGCSMVWDRARTGFGGMVVVTAILLFVQLVSGVEAFPL